MFVKPGTCPSWDDPETRIPCKVRDPDTRRLMPDEGAEVPETSFWLRLLRDGDVVKAEPPKEVTEAPPPAEDLALPAPSEPAEHLEAHQ